MVLDATVNTDFAQIETGDQQINLTRFSLFFPEKRQFFQERSDLFYYRLPGGEERLFHSRQIGLANGSPIPILGGARLAGRAAGWDVGIIDMQTAATRVDDTPLPTANYGVLRLRRPVLYGGS